MKRYHIIEFGLSLLLIITLMCFIGCSNGNEGNETFPPTIELNKTTLMLEKGNSERLVASFIPFDTENKGHKWESFSPNIASVDDTGMVTAVGIGHCTIMAKALYGGSTATCEVSVVEKQVKVTGVSLDKTQETLVAGDKLTLIATIKPDNATNRSVKWTSSDNNVASVDDKGVVTAIASGNVTIKVTTVDGSKEASCKITVIKRGVEFSKPTVGNITSNSALITGMITPLGVTLKEVGICYNTKQTPTINDYKTILSGEKISYTITGLAFSTTYYVRIYAIADGETFYSEQTPFTTVDELKTSFKVTDIYENKVIIESPVPNGIDEINVCYDTNPHPKITDNVNAVKTSEGKWTITLSGLKAGTIYYIRPYVMNGNKAEYLDDEISVETMGGKDFKFAYEPKRYKETEVYSPYYHLLWDLFYPCTYTINTTGTYKLYVYKGKGVVFCKDVDSNFNGNYSSSLYIEDGNGKFTLKRTGGERTDDWDYTVDFSNDTDIVFENLDTGIDYHIVFNRIFNVPNLPSWR